MARLSLRAVCAALLLAIISGRPASSEVPEGTWMLANRVAVQVFECGGLVCGRIVWLVRPRTPDGQPDTDRLNPGGFNRERAMANVSRIYETMSSLIRIAREESIPTYRAADLLAERRIDAVRKAKLLAARGEIRM